MTRNGSMMTQSQRDELLDLLVQLGEQTLSADAAKKVHEGISQEVEAAVEFAKASPMPDPDALLDDVYA